MFATEPSSSNAQKTLTGRIRERLLALTDPLHPAPIRRNGWILLLVLALLSGLPYLFSPLDADSALFYVSGEKILDQGAVHYRDIVDIKPPAIYHLYAAEIALLGHSPRSIRIADYVLQLLSALLILVLARRYTKSDLIAAVAGFSYLLLYFGQSFRNTAQCESYVALLGFGILWLVLNPHNQLSNHKRTLRYLFAGCLVGLLTLFKFTFGILFLLVIAGELIRSDRTPSLRSFLHTTLSTTAGLSIILLGFVLYLFGLGAWDDFLLMKTFTEGYTALQWGSIASGISAILTGMPTYFAVHYSVLFSLLTIVGLGTTFALRSKQDQSPTQEDEASEQTMGTSQTVFLQYCAIAFLLLLLTLMAENKYQGWYFNRLFGFGAVLVAAGGVAVLRQIARAQLNRYALVAGIPLLFAGIVFSPVNRYLYHSAAFVAYQTKGENGLDAYYGYDQGEESMRFADVKTIGDYIKSERKADDEMFVASGFGGLLCMYSSYIPDFRIYHSGFLVAPYAPQQWRDETQHYLLSEKPRFIILHGDGMEPITGTPISSRDAVLSLPKIPELLATHYTRTMQVSMFDVYTRRE